MIDFRNDKRFSIAPPWIVERLVDVPFFSEGENDAQSFHALIVLMGGEKVGVPVYGRRWIKLTADDLNEVGEALDVLSLALDRSVASGDETNGHQLPAETGADMNDAKKTTEPRKRSRSDVMFSP